MAEPKQPRATSAEVGSWTPANRAEPAPAPRRYTERQRAGSPEVCAACSAGPRRTGSLPIHIEQRSPRDKPLHLAVPTIQRRFAPTVVQLFLTVPCDVGRPSSDVADVPRTPVFRAQRTATRDRGWYRLCTMPCLTQETVTDDGPMTFIDIAESTRLETRSQLKKANPCGGGVP